jgi:hypothetical protein
MAGECRSAVWASEGPVGVGSLLRSVDKLMGRKIESTCKISAWDPPNEYGQKAVGGPVPVALAASGVLLGLSR